MSQCQKCFRVIADGEEAWAEEWRRIVTSGTTVRFENVTRYTCLDCGGAA